MSASGRSKVKACKAVSRFEIETWRGLDRSSAMWDLSMTAGRAMTRPPENRSVADYVAGFLISASVVVLIT